MKRLIKNKLTAFLAICLIIVVLILTFKLRTVWWGFIDIFFFFMAAFTHLVAVFIADRSPVESRTLDTFSFWMLIGAFVALLCEFVAWQIII